MSKDSNRRRHYRVMDFQDMITAELGHKKHKLSGFDVRLVDISSGGAGLSAPAGIRRKLARGDRVMLTIRSKRILKPFKIEGELLHLSKGDDRVRISIAFDNWVRDRKNLDHALLRIFNEREAYRVQPQGRMTTEIYLDPEDDSCIEADIRDLSIMGLGLRMNPSDATRLSVDDEVRISFRMPDPPRYQIESQASVRWVKPNSDRKKPTIAGLKLLYDPRADPLMTRTLTQYVMARQRDMRRRGLQEG